MRYLTDKKRNRGDGTLYWQDPQDSENVAVIFPNEGGGLTVSVSEERAMDSYNETFECSAYLSKEAAIKLRDILNEAFPSQDCSEKP